MPLNISSVAWLAICCVPIQIAIGAIAYSFGFRVPYVNALPYALNSLLVTLATLLLFKFRYINSRNIPLFIFPAYAFLAGGLRLVYGGDGSIYDVLVHTSGIYLMVVFWIIGSQFGKEVIENIYRHIEGLSLIIFLVAAAYVFSFAIAAVRDGLYYGPSTGLVLLIYPYFFIKRRWLLCGACMLLVMIGGKRAIMVSLFVATVVLFIFNPNKKHPLIMFLAVTIALLGVSYYADGAGADWVSVAAAMAVDRIYWTVDNFSGDFGSVSAGRSTEVALSWAEFSGSPLLMLFGGGAGWGFERFDEFLTYVHLSPLNYFYYFGAPLAGVLFSQWFLGVNRLRRHAATGCDADRYCFVVLIALMVEGAFSFTYAQTPILWLLLGAGYGVAGLHAPRNRMLSRLGY